MRILFSHRIQSRDGQAVHVDELVAAFRSEGHEVLVVGPPAFDRNQFGGENRAIARLRRFCPGVAYELMELLYNVPSSWRLWRAYRRFRPDFVYERYNLYFLGGVVLKRLCGVPLHLEINAPLADERAIHGGLRMRRLARLLERHVWRSADHAYPVTGILAARMVAAGVPRSAICINPNGVDLERYSPAPLRERAGSGTVTLGFVGFLRDWHGIDTALGVLAAEPVGSELRLVVVGDGPAKPELQRQVAALGVGHKVDFLGLVPRSGLLDLIRRFDVALQPKAVPYASPLKLFEYMALARAIVAPDQPNIREVLTHGRTALLFDPDDPGAMQDAIARLAADPGLRRRLGSAARQELIARDLTWRGNVKRIAARAARDLARHGRPRPQPHPGPASP